MSSRAPKRRTKTKTTRKRTSSKIARTNDAAGGKRPTSEELVLATEDEDLPELYRFWAGTSGGRMPSKTAVVRERIIEWMSDGALVEARLEKMGRRLSAILEAHLHAPRYELSRADLTGNKQLAYLSNYDVEASLTVLQRYGLLTPAKSRRMERYDVEGLAIPADLGDRILRQRRSQRRGIFDAFTLRGHLDRVYSDPSRRTATPASRVREMYKMYSNEGASVSRVERLPDGLRGLVEKVIMQFGGILPKSLFDRMESDLPHWNGKRWKKILQESLVGTVERLELNGYGLNHSDETLVIFNEVALAWLRRVAVPGDPDKPHDEASLGVDLVSNISRFIGYILSHDVRFTVRGEIFKTTEKRILRELIPNPGRELEREEVLDFIYRFARHSQLVESTGERTIALSARGRDWEPQSLEEKLRALLEYTLDERELGGEYFHQARLRRIFLRLLKRVEAGVWYDLMYLPFLARNTYTSSLDEMAVEDYFTACGGTGQQSGTDDLQRLAWNLVGWVRKRLYLLGIVDLGYDDAGRPVALRLTRVGARLLGATEVTVDEGVALGNIVVTPDFEVVLFPGGDDAELTHDLDRFCMREKIGHLIHFRISEKGVGRALSEGMHLRRILETLQRNSRTPVPQNVLYSIRDWGTRAGLMFLEKGNVLRCDQSDTLKAFMQDAGARQYVQRALDERRVQLKKGGTRKRMQAALRDLSYLVELGDEGLA